MEMRSTYYGKKTQSFIKVPQKHDISMLFNYIPGPTNDVNPGTLPTWLNHIVCNRVHRNEVLHAVALWI